MQEVIYKDNSLFSFPLAKKEKQSTSVVNCTDNRKMYQHSHYLRSQALSMSTTYTLIRKKKKNNQNFHKICKRKTNFILISTLFIGIVVFVYLFLQLFIARMLESRKIIFTSCKIREQMCTRRAFGLCEGGMNYYAQKELKRMHFAHASNQIYCLSNWIDQVYRFDFITN